MAEARYRADIDGLRALAVIPVVLFHAGVAGFSGGFVGVDIFFVISGYLITGILIREFEARSYRISKFYERRVRRIAPPLLVVLLFTLTIGPIFMLPSEFKTLGRDAISALLFFANINFWRQADYFSADAETKPLLHMWSLGVEEQFYLFAPLLLLAIFQYLPKHRRLIVGLAAGLSFAACILLTPAHGAAAFYLLPTRAWELLAGALLAMTPRTGVHRNALLDELSGFVGLALICFSVFSYSENTLFPGYAAIAPVLGAALLIRAGEMSNGMISRLLSWAPLVGVGLISYSLYLWHWPLVVLFSANGWLAGISGKFAVVGLSFCAAWLSWRHVERWTRSRQKFPPRSLILAVSCISASVVIVSLYYSSLGGWSSRFSSDVVSLDQSRDDVSPNRRRCHFGDGLPDLDAACELGISPPRVVVWGDSHGVELAQALSELGVGVKQITYSACPPALKRQSRADRPYCEQHNQRTFDYVSMNLDYKVIILVARYSQSGLSNGLAAQVQDTADKLVAAGKRVIVIGPSPIDEDLNVPSHLARGGDRFKALDKTRLMEFSESMKASTEVIFPTQIFCNAEFCDLRPQGSPLLFDAHHLSLSAARILARKVVEAINGRADLHHSLPELERNS